MVSSLSKGFVLLLLVLPELLAAEDSIKYKPLSQEMIDHINAHAETWTAGRNFHPDADFELIKRMMGAKISGTKLPQKRMLEVIGTLPEEFDSRLAWPDCPTIQEVRDQGCCGSCWAVGAAEAISDRICIHSKGQKKVTVSAQNLLACCEDCGNKCARGYMDKAWQYWVDNGLVTGGECGSHQGCQPYTIAPCGPLPNGTKPKCSGSTSPKCSKKCLRGYPVDYAKDLNYGDKAYSVSSKEEEIMNEIMTNGPVEAGFEVYEDFMIYKSGVYIHATGKLIYGHAIKLIGWGIENGTKYWLGTNSIGSNWGDKGFFKFLRGSNHCRIESIIVAGIPKI